jgi:transcriptional regulator with GAF, ATPase, and Fis domain
MPKDGIDHHHHGVKVMLSSSKNSPQKLLDKIQQQEQQIRDYELLDRILRQVNSEIHVEDTLKLIIRETMQLCEADQVSIMLIDSKRLPEPMTLMRQGHPGDENLDHYLNSLLTGWVMHNQITLLSNNLGEIIGKKNVKSKYRNISSVLSVPLMEEGKICGVINLISENKHHLFGEREQHLMTILASQCALIIRHARLHDDLFTETRRLKKEVQQKHERHGIIGNSPNMQAVFTLLDSVLPTDVRVLIEGESGTGKERIARAIHYSGARKEAPFVAIDCGALPANLLESELFGYVKGAFTGANQDRRGLFEEAHGGSLFLDEINNMPTEIQAKFLRALQEGEIRPLGTSQTKKVNARIIAAASKNLKEEVSAGSFRQDLFYRLNVVTIALPSLRERKEDIVILADHFLKQMAEKYGKKIEGFDAATISALEAYSWPGNIRELENAIERAVVLCKTEQLNKNDFDFPEARDGQMETTAAGFEPQPWDDALFYMKRKYVKQVLDYTGGLKKKAAEILKLQPTYFSRLLKNLNLQDKDS